MTQQLHEHYITEEEYLKLEEASDERHEYGDGRMWNRHDPFGLGTPEAMAGASPAHNRITGSAFGSLYGQLRGKPCEPFNSDQRVRAGRRTFYPDIVVACPPLQYDPNSTVTLTGATVIIEVLSPSTGAFDRGGKFLFYSQLPSLHHYLLVEQEQVQVEHRFKGDDGQWRIEVFTSPDDVVKLPAIECELPLRELYERVDVGASP